MIRSQNSSSVSRNGWNSSQPGGVDQDLDRAELALDPVTRPRRPTRCRSRRAEPRAPPRRRRPRRCRPTPRGARRRPARPRSRGRCRPPRRSPAPHEKGTSAEQYDGRRGRLRSAATAEHARTHLRQPRRGGRARARREPWWRSDATRRSRWRCRGCSTSSTGTASLPRSSWRRSTASCYPDAVREIVARGHELGHHGWAHETWRDLSPQEERDALTRGLEAFARLGLRPRGFRPPGGELTPSTPALLREHGFELVLTAEGREYELRDGLVYVPFDWELVDAYHLMDSFAALRTSRGDREARREPAELADWLAHRLAAGGRHDADPPPVPDARRRLGVGRRRRSLVGRRAGPRRADLGGAGRRARGLAARRARVLERPRSRPRSAHLALVRIARLQLRGRGAGSWLGASSAEPTT